MISTQCRYYTPFNEPMEILDIDANTVHQISYKSHIHRCIDGCILPVCYMQLDTISTTTRFVCGDLDDADLKMAKSTSLKKIIFLFTATDNLFIYTNYWLSFMYILQNNFNITSIEMRIDKLPNYRLTTITDLFKTCNITELTLISHHNIDNFSYFTDVIHNSNLKVLRLSLSNLDENLDNSSHKLVDFTNVIQKLHPDNFELQIKCSNINNFTNELLSCHPTSIIVNNNYNICLEYMNLIVKCESMRSVVINIDNIDDSDIPDFKLFFFLLASSQIKKFSLNLSQFYVFTEPIIECDILQSIFDNNHDLIYFECCSFNDCHTEQSNMMTSITKRNQQKTNYAINT